MDSKKHSRIIAAICIGALAIFSIFVFPFILAASPANQEIEVIEMEEAFPAHEPDAVPEDGFETLPDFAVEPGAELLPEPDPIPININAISEEQAIALAWELFAFPEAYDVTPEGAERGHATEFIKAVYVDSTDPASDPSWFLLFSYRYWGSSFAYIPEGLTQEEALNREMEQDVFGYARFSIGTDNFGVPVIKWDFGASHYEMVEINALTGEWIGSGMTDPIYLTDLDELDLYFEDDIRRSMAKWWLIERRASGEIIREPLFHEEYGNSGG